jgi:hypothetical protein
VGTPLAEQEFEILGIAPTNDGRAIRSAFLRLARIYHPDRFSGMPEDVRAEAERRMQAATAADKTLRARERSAKSEAPPIDDPEIKERAKLYRQTMEARRAEERRNRARWLRWDEIERETRERLTLEARMAARIAEEAERGPGSNGNGSHAPDPQPLPGANAAPRTSDNSLGQRLRRARIGDETALAPRESAELPSD